MGETIKIGSTEAALVFRAEGSYELHLPKQDQDEQAHLSSLNAVRCAVMLGNRELISMVDDWMEEHRS